MAYDILNEPCIELGTGILPGDYWQANERDEMPELPGKNNPLYGIIIQHFGKN